MAATATAPRTTRRRTASRARPKPRAQTATARTRTNRRPAARKRGITPAAGFAIPAAAVGKTAVAVGGLADSGFVVRLTRSRVWIGLIGALLVGIVALNVVSLGLNASGSRIAGQAEELTLENSTLRAQLTERLSNEEIQKSAAKLGLAFPEPNAIDYLRASENDAKLAAKRLLGGELAAAGASEEAVVAEAAVAPAPVAPVDPAAVAPVDPAAVAPAATDPAAAAVAPPVAP